MLQPLHFLRVGGSPVKMECSGVSRPGEAGPGMSPGVRSFGVCRGHREKDRCVHLRSAPPVACIGAPPLPCPEHCRVWLSLVLFINSSGDGHLGCSHFSAVMKALLVSVMHSFCVAQAFSVYSPRSATPGHMVTLFNVSRSCQTVF